MVDHKVNSTSPSAIRAHLLANCANKTTGFLSDEEGQALARAAERASSSGIGPLLEIGSYLGRSTLYLASGIAAAGALTVLFSLDHHHGSEEMQEGWPHHDPALVDGTRGRIDTLSRWRNRIEDSGADDLVIGLIGESATVAANWTTPLSLVFVDGGHGEEAAWNDYRGWSPHLGLGGLLLFHDVFPEPTDGGRPPYECYLEALASGAFIEEVDAPTGSLRQLVATGSEKSAEAGPRASTSAQITTAAAE